MRAVMFRGEHGTKFRPLASMGPKQLVLASNKRSARVPNDKTAHGQARPPTTWISHRGLSTGDL